ncbi:MAG: hypothetical protein RLZZ324_1036 [Candidatus Parcubacteria bacterium]|jgi:hypothetical protein
MPAQHRFRFVIAAALAFFAGTAWESVHARPNKHTPRKNETPAQQAEAALHDPAATPGGSAATPADWCDVSKGKCAPGEHADPSLLFASKPAPGIAWCEERKGSCIPKVCSEHRRTIQVFHADWCEPCRRLETSTFTDPAVIAKLASYGAIRVDGDANPGLAKRARLSGYPVIRILDRQCHEVARIEGYVNPEQLLTFLTFTEETAP